jgi:hypothetical protein
VRLDDIRVALRPRSPGEAADLGLRLLQVQARSLYGPWLAMVLPLFVLLHVFLADHPWAPMLILWWLKPVYDRVLLHVLGHALFGPAPTLRATFYSLPSILKNGLWAQLTFLRLMPNRAFLLPVWQLEGLKGAAARKRAQVLKSRGASQSFWLTVACLHMEMALLAGMYGFIVLIVPQTVHVSTLWSMFFVSPPWWARLLYDSLYLCAMTVIEPYYIAAGFMLYIQRRTQLEAWDIEIRFRRMAQRLEAVSALGASAAALLLAVLWCAPVTPARADTAPSAERAEHMIKDILAQEDFATTQTVTTWVPKGWDPNKKKDTPKNTKKRAPAGPLEALIADGVKVLLVLLVIGTLVYLIVNRRRWLEAQARSTQDAPAPPAALFGMDIKPASLPADLLGEARRLWQAGETRAALSLLYRASLSLLVHRDAVALNDAMTESDVLASARSGGIDAARIAYLERLTAAWSIAAYAHRRPAEDTAQWLFAAWPAYSDPGDAA